MRPTQVITGPNTIFSYLNINEPKTPMGGGTPKYSASLIINKDDTATIDAINKAIQAAYDEGEAKLKGNGKSVPPLAAIRTPLRDGDLEKPDDPAYAHSYFVNAKNARKPGVVDAHLNPITDTSELYSGITGRASISFLFGKRNPCRGWSNTVLCVRDLLPAPFQRKDICRIQELSTVIMPVPFRESIRFLSCFLL
ncbi:MAG: DUF2815 family protein [Eubacterium sp.]|nr:DUF2815 family protein [Eubacterium sp.]